MTDVAKMGSKFKTTKERANSYKLISALFASARKSYTCQICLKKFYSEEEIQKHFHNAHKDKAKKIFPNYVDKSFKCAKCDFMVGFSSEDDIRQHLRQMHPDPPVDGGPGQVAAASSSFLPLFPPLATDLPTWYLQCAACDRSHLSRESLLQHIRQRHLDLAPHHCDHCGVAYSSRKRWDQHLYAHHGSAEQQPPQQPQPPQQDAAADAEVVTKYVIQDASGARVQVLQQQNQEAKAPEAIHTFRLEGDKLIQISGGEGIQQMELDSSAAALAPPASKKIRYEYAGTTQEGKQVVKEVLLTEPDGQLNGQQQIMALNLTQGQQEQVIQQVVDETGAQIHYINAADLQQVISPDVQQGTTTTTQMYKCPICDHLEFVEANIVAHIKQAHVIEEQLESLGGPNHPRQEETVQYRCQLCNTLHVSLVALGQHQQQQHGLFPGAQDDAEREDVLRIIQKARETTNQQLVLQQQQEQHQQVMITDQQPEDQPGLPTNQQEQQEQQPQQQQQQCYQCSVCGMQTNQMTTILQHMKKEHGVATRVKCPLCANTYSDQHGLKRHFKKSHANAPASAAAAGAAPGLGEGPSVSVETDVLSSYNPTFL